MMEEMRKEGRPELVDHLCADAKTRSPELAAAIERQRRRDLVALETHKREAAYCNGKHPLAEVPRLRTDAELEAAARRELDAMAAYRASPIGRLRRAIQDLHETQAYAQEVWTMTGILDRASNRPAPAEVGAILVILAPINTPMSRQGIEACAGLLMAERRAA